MSNDLPPEAKVIFYFKQGFSYKDIADKTGCSLDYIDADVKAFVTRIESLSNADIDRIGAMAPGCLVRIGDISYVAALRIREANASKRTRSEMRRSTAYQQRLEGDDFRL